MAQREDPFLAILPPTRVPPRKQSLPLLSFYGRERLIQQHKSMLTPAYKRAFEATAFADEDLYFPHFDQCLDYYQKYSLNDWTRAEKREWWTVAGVDLSSDSRPGTVIYVLSVLPDTRKITRLIWRGKWDAPTTCRMIQKVDDKFRPRRWAVEDNGYQRSLRQWARALEASGMDDGGQKIQITWSKRVAPFVTGSNKVDPMTGLMGMDIEFENYAWIYPGKDAPDKYHPVGHECPGCVWKEEARLFPHHQTTDTVMAMWFAWATAIRFCPYLRGTKDKDTEEATTETAPVETDDRPSDRDDVYGG